MNLLMRMAALETEFVAVERIAEFCRLESEYQTPGDELQGNGAVRASRSGGDPTERAALDEIRWVHGSMPNTLRVVRRWPGSNAIPRALDRGSC